MFGGFKAVGQQWGKKWSVKITHVGCKRLLVLTISSVY